MVTFFATDDLPRTVRSDLAAEFPVYIYLSDERRNGAYSTEIEQLINSVAGRSGLDVSAIGLSFLLQSGAIPPPYTIYKNIFVVGIGDAATLSVENSTINCKFETAFPFFNGDRPTRPQDFRFDELASRIIDRMSEALANDAQSFLFYSAGKDSNTIALALAEAGYQDRVTLLTHQSLSRTDESGIAARFAHKLGFNQVIVRDPQGSMSKYEGVLDRYFAKSPMPNVDCVALTQAIYSERLDLNGSYLIDGMGNDVYMGHIPPRREVTLQKRYHHAKRLRLACRYVPSERRGSMVFRARSEWTGLSGFNIFDANRLNASLNDVAEYWSAIDRKYRSHDYLDLRAVVRGTVIDVDKFAGKTRNLAHVTGGKSVFPWMDEAVARYMWSFPEKELFDRKKLRNKLPLRSLLQAKIGLNSDEVGKFGYPIDDWTMLQNLGDKVEREISECWAWDSAFAKSLTLRLRRATSTRQKSSARARELLYRLYMVSAWLNHCEYVKKLEVKDPLINNACAE